MRREKGSALITVILVVLVLTMVGVAGLLFMSVEDKLSGNDIITKEALFVAEGGLRTAEKLVFARGKGAIGTELSGIVYPPSLRLPTPGVVDDYTANAMALGPVLLDDANQPIQNVLVDIPNNPSGRWAFYTLFIRNNFEDNSTGAGPATDLDGRVNILSRGWIQTSPNIGQGRVLIEKIIEEQMDLGSAGGSGTGNSDTGGTSQIS